MKRETAASLKRVNAANLERLGAARLAELVIAVTASRPELKRRIRMELAAALGVEHLAPEIDKRIGAIETGAGKVSWRVRPTFLRELDALRVLIVERMAPLDRTAALDRLWRFMGAARRVADRLRGRDEELSVVFARAAADIGRLIGAEPPVGAAGDLAAAIVSNPRGWSDWLAPLIGSASPGLAAETLAALRARSDAGGAVIPHIRALADAAGDVDAFMATYSAHALLVPASAAAVAERLLGIGLIDRAGAILRGAAPEQGRASAVDFEWESAWIDYLEAAGDEAGAQAARWAAFERTLAVQRMRDFTRRLKDFDDVEAEQRAFAYAAAHPGFRSGLRFLMDWPALPEAARMIEAREADVSITTDEAELWSAKLRRRQPRAAQILLRKAAAAAFKRRDFKTSTSLTQDADTIDL
jgi:hypothetical protein